MTTVEPIRYKALGEPWANWFDYADAYAYMAERIPANGVFVELGVWRGRSMCYMYEKLLARHGVEGMPRMVGVDYFSNQDKFTMWEKGVSLYDTVRHDLERACVEKPPELIVGNTAAAAGAFAARSVDAIWVDAGHDERSVCADLAAWMPKLKPGGIMAGHDYNSHVGVRKGLMTMGIPHAARGRWWMMV